MITVTGYHRRGEQLYAGASALHFFDPPQGILIPLIQSLATKRNAIGGVREGQKCKQAATTDDESATFATLASERG
jgi:hypothetical protein